MNAPTKSYVLAPHTDSSQEIRVPWTLDHKYSFYVSVVSNVKGSEFHQIAEIDEDLSIASGRLFT